MFNIYQAELVLTYIIMVLYWPTFSLMFLIHLFLYAGIYCISYMGLSAAYKLKKLGQFFQVLMLHVSPNITKKNYSGIALPDKIQLISSS